MKQIRIKDETILDKYRRRSCCICNSRPTDPCHIKTKGSGGGDTDNNLLAMCRKHHIEQHAVGFFRMCQLYPMLKVILAEKGWLFGGDKKLRRY